MGVDNRTFRRCKPRLEGKGSLCRRLLDRVHGSIPNHTRRSRRLQTQQLEPRTLLAGDPFGVNALQPLDVNRDGDVSPLDALIVINGLARSPDSSEIDPRLTPGVFTDVSNDGKTSPLDALHVINGLASNRPLVTAKLVNDSSKPDDIATTADLFTHEYALQLKKINDPDDQLKVELRLGDQDNFVEISDQFVDEVMNLSESLIDEWAGEIPDQSIVPVEIRYGVAELDQSLRFEITVDRREVRLLSTDVADLVLPGTREINLFFDDDAGILDIDLEAVAIETEGQPRRHPTSFQVLEGGRRVEFMFDQGLPEGDHQLSIDPARMSTPAGFLAAPSELNRAITVRPATVYWTGSRNSSWFVGANWSTGEVPQENDFVVIDAGGGTITNVPTDVPPFRQLNLANGTITDGKGLGATKSIQLDNATLDIFGLELIDTHVVRGRQSGFIKGAREIRNSTIDVNIEVEPFEFLNVREGLTLNGSLSLRGSVSGSTSLLLFGNQTIDGTGTISMSGQRVFIYALRDESADPLEEESDPRVHLTSSLTLQAGGTAVLNPVPSDPKDRIPIQLESHLTSSRNSNLVIDGLVAARHTNFYDFHLDNEPGTVLFREIADGRISNRGRGTLETTHGGLLKDVTLVMPLLVQGRTTHFSGRVIFARNIYLEASEIRVATLAGLGSTELVQHWSVASGQILGSLAVPTKIIVGEPLVKESNGVTTFEPHRIMPVRDPDSELPINEQVFKIERGVLIEGKSVRIGGVSNSPETMDVNAVLRPDAGSEVELRRLHSSFQIDLMSGGIYRLPEISDARIWAEDDVVIPVDDEATWTRVIMHADVEVLPNAELALRESFQFASGSQIHLKGDDTGDAIVTIDAFTGPSGIDVIEIKGGGQFVFGPQATSPDQNQIVSDQHLLTHFQEDVSFIGYQGQLTGPKFGETTPIRVDGAFLPYEHGVIDVRNVIGSGSDFKVIMPAESQVFLPRLVDATIEGSVHGGSYEIHDRYFWSDVTIDIAIDVHVDFSLSGDSELNRPLNIISDGSDTLTRLLLDSESELRGNGTVNLILDGDGETTLPEVVGIDETSVIGPDITIRGTVGNLRRLEFQGELIILPNGALTLFDMTSAPGRLDLKPQDGLIHIGTLRPGTTVNAVRVDDQWPIISVIGTLRLDNVTMNVDLYFPVRETITPTLLIRNQTTINSLVRFPRAGSRVSFLQATQGQPATRLSGTGTLRFEEFDGLGAPPESASVVATNSSGTQATIGALIKIDGGKVRISGRELTLLARLIDRHEQITVGSEVTWSGHP